MNLEEFTNNHLKEKLGINESFGRIFSSIDFGNVDYWYEHDERDVDGSILPENEKLVIGIEKLFNFCNAFSIQKKFYYGLDHRRDKSNHMIRLARA